MKILCYINTFKRYDSTLTMALISMANQTRRPDKFVLFDDNPEPQDLRTIEHYNYIFKLFDQKGIPWEVIFGERKGAHYSHEKANTMGYDAAFFADDDQVLEANCLEELEKELVNGVGAVGGLILQPPAGPLPIEAANKIDDLTLPNIQWFVWDGKPKEVEHIYSAFLYRCGVVHHDLRLSSVVFRGETMFTHSLFLKGYKLIVTPKAVTWHFQSTTGGCRTGEEEKVRMEKYAHDEWLFQEWLQFKKSGKKIYLLNAGKGDHYMFRQVITPETDSIVACCYPEVFPEYRCITIDEAAKLVDPKDYDVYRFCVENNWKGTLLAAYKQLYAHIN